MDKSSSAGSPNAAPKSVDDELETFFETIDSQTTAIAKSKSFKSSNIEVTYDLELPIEVAVPGSRVKYAFSTDGGDISFGLYIQPPGASQNKNAGTEEDVELLEITRVKSDIDPITGTITIPSPCTLLFYWDNHYSWFRAKRLSYSVSILPPTEDVVQKMRTDRLNEVLGDVMKDKEKTSARLEKISEAREILNKKVIDLENQLRDAKSHLAVARKEEQSLTEKIEMRKKQADGLKNRLGLK